MGSINPTPDSMLTPQPSTKINTKFQTFRTDGIDDNLIANSFYRPMDNIRNIMT